MDLVDDPVHDPLEEIPREIESLGRHEVGRGHGTEDHDLVIIRKLGATIGSQIVPERTYVAIDPLVSHNTHSAARVNGSVGCCGGSASI